MAKRCDIVALASLSRREIEYGLPWTWTPSRLGRFLKLPTTNTYVATANNNVIGFAIASLGEARAHLVLLAVAEKYRRRGIGNQLLQMQLHSAQTAGLTDISLEVRASNTTAQHFYIKAGFEQLRMLKDYYCGAEDALRYRMSPIRAQIPSISKFTSTDRH